MESMIESLLMRGVYYFGYFLVVSLLPLFISGLLLYAHKPKNKKSLFLTILAVCGGFSLLDFITSFSQITSSGGGIVLLGILARGLVLFLICFTIHYWLNRKYFKNT